jgi:NADPH2:quinone reductase
MKAIRVHEFGEPEVLKFEEVPTPTAGPGQALIKMQAIGLNYVEIYQRRGLYKGTLPFTVGNEGAGVVEALGSGVAEVRVGDRVAFTGIPGTYAEYAVAPADRLVKLPAGIDTKQGAAAILQGLTAHYLVYSTYPLKKDETCLVHAAAGGVGLLLCQMARRIGARVIGTVSTEEKAKLAREAGADEVILYTKQDFVAEVKRLTNGRGVQVVYESVGKDTFEKSLNCLARRGYLVLFGQSSGPVAAFDPQILSMKGSLFLTRPTLVHHIETREELLSRATDLFDLVGRGELKLRIGATFPLSEAAQAHRELQGRKTTGKVLLIP